MTEQYMLDGGPLGQMARSKRQKIADWIEAKLAAQALEMDAQVFTENIAHVSRYVAASWWQDLPA